MPIPDGLCSVPTLHTQPTQEDVNSRLHGLTNDVPHCRVFQVS